MRKPWEVDLDELREATLLSIQLGLKPVQPVLLELRGTIQVDGSVEGHLQAKRAMRRLLDSLRPPALLIMISH